MAHHSRTVRKRTPAALHMVNVSCLREPSQNYKIPSTSPNLPVPNSAPLPCPPPPRLLPPPNPVFAQPNPRTEIPIPYFAPPNQQTEKPTPDFTPPNPPTEIPSPGLRLPVGGPSVPPRSPSPTAPQLNPAEGFQNPILQPFLSWKSAQTKSRLKD